MQANRKPSLLTTLSVLGIANYRRLFISSTCSFFGMNMQMVLLALVAWELTKSFTLSGMLMASSALPMLLFTLPGGAIVDRVNKRTLMMFTQVGMGSLNLLCGILILTEDISVWSLLGLGIAQGSIISIGMPARTPLMASVVSPQRIGSAIAVSNMSMNMSRVVGPMLGVAIIEFFPHFGTRFDVGYEWGYMTSGLLGIISIIPLLKVPSSIAAPQSDPSNQKESMSIKSILRDIGAGISYVYSTPRLRLLMVLMLVLTIFAQPFQNLIAGFAESGLKMDDWQAKAGQLTAMAGVGAMIGSVLITWLAEWDRKPLLQWLSGLATAAGFITMTVGSQMFGFAGAVVGVTIVGGATAFYMTASSTMMLTSTNPKFYGRVMSLFMLSFSAVGVMSLPLGMVADRIGSLFLFSTLGICVALAMLMVAIIKPSFVFQRLASSPNFDEQLTSGTEKLIVMETPPGQVKEVSQSLPANKKLKKNREMGSIRLANSSQSKRRSGYGIRNESGVATDVPDSKHRLRFLTLKNSHKTNARTGYGVLENGPVPDSKFNRKEYGLGSIKKESESKGFSSPPKAQRPLEDKVSVATADEKVLVKRITPDAIIAAQQKNNIVANILKKGSIMGAAAAMVALVVFSLRKKK